MATGQPSPGRPRRIDQAFLALAALLVVVGAVSASEPSGGARGPGPLAAGLLLAGAAAVAAGGRFPAAGALGALAATFAWYGSGHDSGLVNIVPMAAFYRLGASDGQRRKVAVTVAAVTATALMMLGVGTETWQDTAAAAAYPVVAVLFGELLRSRRLLVDRYAERAARAEADAERKLAEERLSIARDVHDVLAHTVSVMTVQAGVALDSLDRDRPGTVAALQAIRAEGRSAMDEVRALVSLLRSPAEGRGGRAPVPRLDGLGELVQAAEAQGMAVDVDVSLADGPVPELVELTAFRIVQECLTNAARHAAGASRVAVAIRGGGGRLTVEVRDDGRTGGRVSPGYGLRGIAERVEAIGGSLHHGFADGGGFHVRAELPAHATGGHR